MYWTYEWIKKIIYIHNLSSDIVHSLFLGARHWCTALFLLLMYCIISVICTWKFFSFLTERKTFHASSQKLQLETSVSSNGEPQKHKHSNHRNKIGQDDHIPQLATGKIVVFASVAIHVDFSACCYCLLSSLFLYSKWNLLFTFSIFGEFHIT